jgi:hypothetical protein
MSMVDLPLIQQIHTMLGGLGTIYQYPHRNEARLAIMQKGELTAFLALVFSNNSLLVTQQFRRLALLRYVLENNVNRLATEADYTALLYKFEGILPVIPTDTDERIFLNNWVSGFVNGEGSFGVDANNKVFTFSTEQTDLPVLDLVQQQLGLSKTPYVNKLRPRRKQS